MLTSYEIKTHILAYIHILWDKFRNYNIRTYSYYEPISTYKFINTYYDISKHVMTYIHILSLKDTHDIQTHTMTWKLEIKSNIVTFKQIPWHPDMQTNTETY